MGIVTKIICGSHLRKTRFHDENGQFMGWSSFKYLPINIVYIVGRKMFGLRPELPWWPFVAIHAVKRCITPEAKVIEFGSGMSTVWLARRAGYVVSIEDRLEWYEKVKKFLAHHNLQNVDYRLRAGLRYYDLSEWSGPTFDLAIVDGSHRWRCIEAVLPLLKEKGCLYLDNADADKDFGLYSKIGQKIAQQIISDTAREKGWNIEQLNSLTVCELSSSEGWLVRK
jgi:Methyltransferase domain